MKVLVLAGGYDQIALIEELKDRGIEVILIDYLYDPPAKNIAHRHCRESTLDINAVRKIALKEKPDLITTACTDQALLTAAQLSEELGLSFYLSYQTALNVTNKSHMKVIFEENEIPTPKYIIIDTFDSTKVSSFNFPIVVKPVDCNSSKGINKVYSHAELETAIQEALESSRTNRAIIEEFKEGIEISVDVYVEDGKAKVMLLTESNKIKHSNRFTISQSIYPVNIPEKTMGKINAIAQRISEAFKIDNSPMLIQLITDGEEVNVLEFSARMGGGTKYKLIEVLSGVNIMKVYADRVLGELPQINYSRNTKFARLNYCYCHPGVFEKLENFEELKQQNVLLDYFQYKTKGAVISKSETSSDRVAGYILVGNTERELLEKQEKTKKGLKVISDEGVDMLMHCELI